MRYEYPARVRVYEDEVVVTFRDVPGVAGGATREEALANAADVLKCALWVVLKDGHKIPSPSAPKRGDVTVPVSPGVAAKLAFASALQARCLSGRAFAKKFGVDEREVRRMLNPDHPTKIERLDEALQVLGKRLVVSEKAA